MAHSTIYAVGKTVSATTTASGTTLPNTQNGQPPRFVRVAAGTTGGVYIKFGGAGVTATANDIYLPGYNADVFNVFGSTNFSVISASGTISVNVTPLENTYE